MAGGIFDVALAIRTIVIAGRRRGDLVPRGAPTDDLKGRLARDARVEPAHDEGW
jgi:hypothetical protein